MVRRLLLVSILLALFARPASASTIFFDSFSPQQAGWSRVGSAGPAAGYLGELNDWPGVTDVSLTVVSAIGGSGALEFDLIAFRSLDGWNCCYDILTLNINGSEAFVGAFVYGWPGASYFTSNPSGASFSPIEVFYPDGRGIYHFTVPFALLAGVNTFTWSYSISQPTWDEAFGLDNVGVIATPEPISLLLTGIGLTGAAWIRRRRRE